MKNGKENYPDGLKILFCYINKWKSAIEEETQVIERK